MAASLIISLDSYEIDRWSGFSTTSSTRKPVAETFNTGNTYRVGKAPPFR
jgi:hypothetical protein